MADEQRELLANIAPFGLRMQSDLKDRVKAAAEANNRSMNAEIIARLEQSFVGFGDFSDQQIRDLKGAVESLEWQRGKLEIDIGHAVATTREVTTLLKGLMDSPAEKKTQAVLAGMRVIESAATYLGRPYTYSQMKTGRFVEESPPADPLAEVIATAEWLEERLLFEYRRLRDEK